MEQLVLVAEDEPQMRTMVMDYLQAIGYRVAGAADGPEALKQCAALKPAMVLLDIMMPGLDGYEVVRRIRQESAVPIILLTARAGETDKLMGLELGADDYMVKPFSVRELAARIRAIFRRTENAGTSSGQPTGQTVYRLGPFVLDYDKRQLRRDGTELALTAVQFEIVARMMKQPGRVFSRAELLDTVAEGLNSEAYERTVDAHIKNIRKVIEPVPANPRYVITLRNAGYRFAELDAAERAES